MQIRQQEFIHDPDNGVFGDCQRAVISSLLELPMAEVPHFMRIAQGDTAVFWDEIQKFVAKYNFAYIEVPASTLFFHEAPGCDFWHVISGPSPRDPNIAHSVIGLSGNYAYDPHPTRAGLAGDPSQWVYGFLVPRALDLEYPERTKPAEITN